MAENIEIYLKEMAEKVLILDLTCSEYKQISRP
jgi:hypothetical protein